jgi:hypothetical protein
MMALLLLLLLLLRVVQVLHCVPASNHRLALHAGKRQ